MDLRQLQTNYPRFTYKKAVWKLIENDLQLSFLFWVEPGIKFNPSVAFKKVPAGVIERLGEPIVQQIAFLVGMAEIPTYWKATCSPEIVVEAGYLKNDEIGFWQDLIKNGMGQFYFENKLPFITPKFKIDHAKPIKSAALKTKLNERFLVPLGGGKDSLVSYEILGQANKEIATLVVQPNQALKDVAGFIGAPNIEISRTIDPLIIELNRRKFLNGHTPFSAVLAFDLVAAALIYNFKYVAISQERSSNEGNIKYLGQIVNHQYSKTFDFEKKFRKYVKKNLSSGVEFFSLLRPLYELQIAKIFSNYPKYFPIFLSCNKPFTLAARQQAGFAPATCQEAGTRTAGAAGWCGNCPKCLFTFAALYPFIGEQATAIFGKNLFDQKGLLPLMLELLGEGACKPFECVGTFAEARAAFYLSLQKSTDPKPFLLQYFETKLLPKYPKIAKQANSILKAWNKNSNMSAPLQSSIKNAIQN